jgi:hypothetical protein
MYIDMEHCALGVGIAQSVQRRAISSTARVRFSAWQDLYFLHTIHTGSEAHSASYTMGTGDDFPEGKEAGA